MQISDDTAHLLDIAHFKKQKKKIFYEILPNFGLRVIVQNCKIGTSTLMKSSSSNVAWKLMLYRVETSAEVCHFQI